MHIHKQIYTYFHTHKHMYIYTHTCMIMYTYIDIHILCINTYICNHIFLARARPGQAIIYIYLHKDRERQTDTHTHTHTRARCCTHTYISMRERRAVHIGRRPTTPPGLRFRLDGCFPVVHCIFGASREASHHVLDLWSCVFLSCGSH